VNPDNTPVAGEYTDIKKAGQPQTPPQTDNSLELQVP
jgi:hypothetical protein